MLSHPARPGSPVAREAPQFLLVSRWTVLGSAAFGLLALTWAAGATWYAASHDLLPRQVTSIEAELRSSYEDRVSELRQRLEREITQGLVERNGFAARAEALAARQGEIEARQAWLGSLLDRSGRAPSPAVPDAAPPVAPPAAAPLAPPPAPSPQKPTPLADDFGALRTGEAESPTAPTITVPATSHDRLSRVEASLQAVATAESELVERLRRDRLDRLARVKSALAATGLDPGRLGRDGPVGGPLVALPTEAPDGGFGIGATEVLSRQLSRLLASARSLPLAQPLAGELEPTSPFGYRLDPFTRGAALHTGLDLRAEAGTPVRSTAPGRVVVAEYVGGYGNLVEVDHGNGLTTRYGHLSAFTVAPGTPVEAGQTIGRVGSTGRSTGFHLHYEVRIDGEPVSPARFLEAGRKLAALGH